VTEQRVPLSTVRRQSFYQAKRVHLRDISGRKKEELVVTTFLGIVSHELRTILAVIKAFAEILHRRPNIKNDEKVWEYLARSTTNKFLRS
jgi:signal transduction histidine kinase